MSTSCFLLRSLNRKLPADVSDPVRLNRVTFCLWINEICSVNLMKFIHKNVNLRETEMF